MAWIFLPCILAFILQYIATIVVMEGGAVYAMGTFKGSTVDELMDYMFDIILSTATDGSIYVLYAVVGVAIFVTCYNKMFMKGKSYSIKGISKNIPLTIVGLILFCIGMQYISMFLMNALGVAFPSWLEEYENIIESAGLDDEISVLMAVYAVFLGPVVEEFIFRGITYSAAKKLMPYYLAIFVQALLFGAFHLNPIQGCYAFVLGLGLGYIMYLYDNIFLTIFVHIVYNIVGTFFTELLPLASDTVYTLFFSILFALIVTYGSLVFLKNGAASVKNEADYTDI
ncbi:CPBP family intramembrane glutamic endopeptidase [Pseudobutyrivibrio ruminis]|uniref:CPBP family intramembrane glutamic endopeptidase n=1 Tax=Pseudobutyrivibrio ruminis TaxID=46206 RepID=UPI001A9A094E|nr:type II CAAX endopeptidase family protein [Pseudobutyrivibrio ruminis]